MKTCFKFSCLESTLLPIVFGNGNAGDLSSCYFGLMSLLFPLLDRAESNLTPGISFLQLNLLDSPPLGQEPASPFEEQGGGYSLKDFSPRAYPFYKRFWYASILFLPGGGWRTVPIPGKPLRSASAGRLLFHPLHLPPPPLFFPGSALSEFSPLPSSPPYPRIPSFCSV